MSRMSDDCFAGVTFATNGGTCRCHWSQHRSRRQPDGDLLNLRHAIADALQRQENADRESAEAAAVRSTRNLSGGESSIESLALVLGLSRMSSRKVRVDSLFLDEGFGTLDEDSLETALDALSGIQQHGKLIGIISHVAVLRDRLTTQIAVRPLSGGKSTLIGPGVSSPSC